MLRLVEKVHPGKFKKNISKLPSVNLGLNVGIYALNKWLNNWWDAFWHHLTTNITYLGDQCQSSFSSSEFLWKNRLLTLAVTFTNSRPVAARRRKRAVTKTNEGGCEGGRASGEVGWTSLSISELHFYIGGPATEPAGSTSSHHLSDCWGGADGSGPAFDESVCVRVCQLRPFRWGPETNIHSPDFPPQLLDWRKMRKMLWS